MKRCDVRRKERKNRGRLSEGRYRYVLGGAMWTQGPLGGAQGDPRRTLEGPRGSPRAPQGPITHFDPTTFGPKTSLGGKGGENKQVKTEWARI